MSTLDAATVAQNARRLGLVTEEQLMQAWREVGKQTTDPERLLLALERKGHLTPFQSGKLLKGDEHGYFLSGYRILYKIASGSFGRVYRADDPRNGRVVAVKILRRRWSEDPQRIEFFNREGKLGMTLQHPNIVEILQASQDPASGQYYIVMEFVEGWNLREMLTTRKKLEPKEALKLMEDCVGGLAHAYSRGMTHRDVKLTNILVSTQGAAKLVDFGLATIYAASGKDEEKVERTVDYAGLERTTGVKQGDVRSDIFFLGCVLYEMLTGRPPLTPTRDKLTRMSARRFAEIAPMRRDEVDAPGSVFRLVETMMAVTPALRYQTPSQLLDAARGARRELEGGRGGETRKEAGPRSVFLAEADPHLQETLREKFKKQGYRVFLAIDPTRALDRFRQQPYDALIVDAQTTGEDGLLTFDRIMAEAHRLGQRCAGILVLAEEQADWQHRVQARPNVAVMVRPGVTMKQLQAKLEELLADGR